MEEHARKAYEAHLKRILLERLKLDFTGKDEEKKQFDEDVASLFVLKRVEDVAQIKSDVEKNKND